MRKIHVTTVVCLVALAGAQPAVGDVFDLVITELQAVNDSTLQDFSGDFPDWFEVLNDGPDSVNLDGVYATDDAMDLTKWRFPAKTLAPGEFVVVFASDKDLRDPGMELHTNFELSSVGETLALVAPDGLTVIWFYGPYPPQVADVSYGLRHPGGGTTELIGSTAPARAIVPSNNSLGLTWTMPPSSFNDASWTSGSTGVGYDETPTYAPLINLDLLTVMNDTNTCAYIRVPFSAPADIASQSFFRLRMKYDDGFRAYINGTQVAGQFDANIDNPPAGQEPHEVVSTAEQPDALAQVFEEFIIPGASTLLRVGSDNVLAIHGLNQRINSSDFLIVPEMESVAAGVLDRSTEEFFSTPSPGSPNGTGFPGVAPLPALSPTGTVFSGNIQVSQTVVSGTTVFRYTTDGSEPTESSPSFPANLDLNASTLVRVRGFDSGLAPSPIVSEGYMSVAAEVVNFSSPLPIILVDTFGVTLRNGNNQSLDEFRAAFMAIFEPGGDGMTHLDLITPPTVQSRVGIKVRGSSTDRSSLDKKSYRFEFWDESNQDTSFEFMGLPRESDFVMYGSHNWDRSVLRTPFAYNLSRDIGQYSVRTRPAEVFVNSPRVDARNAIVNDPDLSAITLRDFFGYYTFMENIKRDGDRVDITRLRANDNAIPEITGGWIFKFDRLGPGEAGFPVDVPQNGVYVYPDEFDLTANQKAWLPDHLQQLIDALNGPDFADPVLGYAPFLEVNSWIDHNILGTLVMNVDALRLSAYYHKDREGPIVAGPLWDTDRSIDSNDGRDNDPEVWFGSGDATQYFSWGWWNRFFEDPNFMQLWVDRWADLRRNEFTTPNINALIDSMAGEVSPVIARNFSDSPDQFHQPGGGWTSELNKMKNWLEDRVNWIDDQFVTAPNYSHTGQQINPGFSLTVSAPAGTIYLTRDGTDPRLPGGGGVSPTAEVVPSGSSITLNSNAQVVARAFDPAHAWSADSAETLWSAPTVETFYVSLPTLVVTEMMYHPLDAITNVPDADDFEFIEVQNIGALPVNLEGARFFGGIDFEFPDIDLQPGEFVVAVSNLAAFETRYDTSGMLIAGQYSRRLNNAGDTVGFEGPLGEPIHLYDYSDTWYPTTDGDGSSLEIVDVNSPLNTWGDQASWQPSLQIDGTPGAGPPPVTDGLQIPGDGNQDGDLDLSDSVWLLRHLFGGATGLPCQGTLTTGGNLVLLDVNDDSTVNLADAVFGLTYLFSNGPPPVLGTSCQLMTGCFNACNS